MGGGKIKRTKGTGRRSSKIGAKTDFATTFSMAEEVNASLAGDNRACSNRRSRKDKCSSGEGTRTGDRGFS